MAIFSNKPPSNIKLSFLIRLLKRKNLRNYSKLNLMGKEISLIKTLDIYFGLM